MDKKNEFKEYITSDTSMEKVGWGNEVGRCQKKKDKLSKEKKKGKGRKRKEK